MLSAASFEFYKKFSRSFPNSVVVIKRGYFHDQQFAAVGVSGNDFRCWEPSMDV